MRPLVGDTRPAGYRLVPVQLTWACGASALRQVVAVSKINEPFCAGSAQRARRRRWCPTSAVL